MNTIIFGTETPIGRAFDVGLLWCILLSVGAVLAESVPSIRAEYGSWLRSMEWIFTVLFTVEYLLRLISVERPRRYARSFFGMVDLISILPTYISLMVPGAQSFLVIRAFRLLRVVRVLKLARMSREAGELLHALKASREKISVFLMGISVTVLLVGTLMYLIEGEANGFTSIPRSIYWAIVTMTTVGYGNVAPQTALGQSFAALMMVLGYGIIAVPTGIVSAELVDASRKSHSGMKCDQCHSLAHDRDARFCDRCGAALSDNDLADG